MRVLLKLSGESLGGPSGKGIDEKYLVRYAREIVEAVKAGHQVAVVNGGGNFFRGLQGVGKGFDRITGDRMGMLATAMNCLAVADVFRQLGCDARVMTAVDIQGVGERYDTRRAIEYLQQGKVVLFGCGTGMPFFSTDTAATLRAAEIHADAILLAKNVDGVYDDDPRVNPAAVKFDEISYDEVLARRLAVMDSTATSMAMDNHIPVIVFALAEPENIRRVLRGEEIGTTVQ